MSRRTSIRIPDDLYAKLVERAKKEQRTVSNLIVSLLTNVDKNTGKNTNAADRDDTGRDIRH